MNVPFLLACSNLLFDIQGIEFRIMCRFLADLGYRGLELVPNTMVPTATGLKKVRDLSDTDAVELTALAKSFGLTITGFQQIFRGLDRAEFSLTSNDEAVRVRATSELENLLRICKQLSGQVVGIGSPAHRMIPEGSNPLECFGRIVEAMQLASLRAKASGVRLLIEPLDPKSFISTPLEAMQILASTGVDGFGYLYDTAAAETQHGGVIGVLTQLLTLTPCQLQHVHLRELDGGAPGTGSIDFRGVLQTLKSSNYSSWVTVEPVVTEETGPDAHDHARKAMFYLRSCLI